jgi:hypothetical protein
VPGIKPKPSTKNLKPAADDKDKKDDKAKKPTDKADKTPKEENKDNKKKAGSDPKTSIPSSAPKVMKGKKKTEDKKPDGEGDDTK